TNDIINRKKISSIIHLLDKGKFMIDGSDGFFRNIITKLFPGSLPGKKYKLLLGCTSITGNFFGIFILQCIEGKLASFRDLLCAKDSTGVMSEESLHCINRFHMSFGIFMKPEASSSNGAFFADAG